MLRSRVQKQPDGAVVRFCLAQALVKRGAEPGSAEVHRALDGLARAVDELPSEALPLIELGKPCVRSRQTAMAVAPLERAARLAPRDRRASYSLMLVLRRIGRSEDGSAPADRMREELRRSRTEKPRRTIEGSANRQAPGTRCLDAGARRRPASACPFVWECCILR